MLRSLLKPKSLVAWSISEERMDQKQMIDFVRLNAIHRLYESTKIFPSPFQYSVPICFL